MARRPGLKKYDVVVVGAGSAGTASAIGFARAGLKVALLERSELGRAGARWINGVPSWLLRRAGWWPLDEQETLGRPGAFHIAGPRGSPRVTVDKPDLFAVRVGSLVDRLHRLAREAGVHLVEKARWHKLRLDGGRPVRLELSATRQALEAALFVDASGLGAALARQVPALEYGRLPEEDLCHAAQGLYRVADLGQAEEFCRRMDLAPGDSLSFNGIEGPFSTLAVRLSLDLGQVELLAGAIAGGGRRSGPRLLEDFRRRLDFVGGRILGGSGLVPLRPARRLWAPGVALVGDAAGQVYAAHGSGTGAGLLAARRLCETCARAGDPGGAEALRRYERAWREEAGTAFPAADVFRRQLCRRGEKFVPRLLQVAAAAPDVLRGGLEQRLSAPGIGQSAKLLRALASRPGAALEFSVFLFDGLWQYCREARWPGRGR